MKTIVIAGELTSSTTMKNDKGEYVIGAVQVITGYGNSRVSGELGFVCYGKAAEAFINMDAQQIIVSGELEMDKRDDGSIRPTINRAQVSECLPGTNINMVNLVGRLGRDPEMTYTNSSKAVTKFSIAAQRTKQLTDWFNVEAWGKQAEVLEKYLSKGNQVALMGEFKIETWTDRESQEQRTGYKVNVNSFTFIGGRNETQEVAASSAPAGNEYDDDF
jgi:single-strand DNA-binding protein